MAKYCIAIINTSSIVTTLCKSRIRCLTTLVTMNARLLMSWVERSLMSRYLLDVSRIEGPGSRFNIIHCSRRTVVYLSFTLDFLSMDISIRLNISLKEDILARVILLCNSSGIFFGQDSYHIL